MLDSFIDEAMIIIASGSGGNGCVSFYRGPFVPYGGPDGGHGGRGGSIIVSASSNINTLYSFKRNRRFLAEKGKDGAGGNCTGASGKDLIILLPVGTQIFDTASNLLLADLSTHGQQEVLLYGGSGGAGNIGFKNSYNQAPRTAIKGEPGCELRVLLQLKLLSDVGIVGLPNVGKSTLLSRCSRSPTKIAPYAFTTLSPKLGVVFLSDYEDFVMADLPGLVEGASEGFGCGIRFLKHVERCSLLLHVIDATSPDPLQDYQTIRHELCSYSKELLQKEEIVAISKIDEVDEDRLAQIRQSLASVTGKRILAFSALLEDTIFDLVHYIYQEVRKQREPNHSS